MRSEMCERSNPPTGPQAAERAAATVRGTTTLHVVPGGLSPLAPTSIKSSLFVAAMPSNHACSARGRRSFDITTLRVLDGLCGLRTDEVGHLERRGREGH